MELENYCWIFKSVLTPKFCDDLIEHSKTKEELLGWTGNHKPHSTDIKAIKDLKKTRDSNIILNGTIVRLVSLLNTNLINTILGM